MIRQTVFVVLSATRRIREIEAEIVSCKRWTWAILPEGRRCLLGTSAFFTRKAAEIRKLGLLRKIVESSAMRNMPRTRMIYESAWQQLRTYNTQRVLQ